MKTRRRCSHRRAVFTGARCLQARSVCERRAYEDEEKTSVAVRCLYACCVRSNAVFIGARYLQARGIYRRAVFVRGGPMKTRRQLSTPAAITIYANEEERKAENEREKAKEAITI